MRSDAKRSINHLASVRTENGALFRSFVACVFMTLIFGSNGPKVAFQDREGLSHMLQRM